MRELPRSVLLCAAVVVCGAVMTILDSTIVNVAIERLADAFDSQALDDPVGVDRRTCWRSPR